MIGLYKKRWLLLLFCLNHDLTFPTDAFKSALPLHSAMTSSSKQYIPRHQSVLETELFSSSSLPLSSTSSSSSSSFSDVFTEEIAAYISDEVQEKVKLPFFIPDPIIEFIITQVIEKLSSDISFETLERIEEMLEAESTKSKYDDTSESDRNMLADQVANELNAKINVPIFNEEQELHALQQIIRTIFLVLTTSESESKKSFVKKIKSLHVFPNILSSEESRYNLVKKLNDIIDLPLLGKTQEAIILQKAVNTCADTLQRLLPPELIQTLQKESNTTTTGLSQIKEYFIIEVTNQVNLFGVSKEQEKTLIESLVNLLIDMYVDETFADGLLLTNEEEKEFLKERQIHLNHELTASQHRFEYEQKNVQKKLKIIQMRLEELS